MARTLPSAKAGGGRLQHSRNHAPLDFSKITVREMTPEMKAKSAAEVQQGKERAGLGDPAVYDAYQKSIQVHAQPVLDSLLHIERRVAEGTLNGGHEAAPISKNWIETYGDTMPLRSSTHHEVEAQRANLGIKRPAAGWP